MKRLTLAVLLVIVSACAIYPPPKIENGCYHNYKYGFMLDLPAADWVPIEKPPLQLIGGTPRELRKDFMLALINKETDGMIVVLSNKTQLSSGEIWLASTVLQAGFFAGMHPELKDTRRCHDSLTHLHYPWDACVEFEHEDAISKSKGNIFFTFFTVGKKVNMIKIILSSSGITYEQNFPAFFELVKSLRHGEEYTDSQLTEEREGLRQKKASKRPPQGADKVASLPKPESSISADYQEIIGRWWMEGEYMVIGEMDGEFFIQMDRIGGGHYRNLSGQLKYKYRGTKHSRNISWDGKQLKFEIWMPSAAGDYKVFYALTLLDRNTLCGTKQASGSPTRIEVEFKRR